MKGKILYFKGVETRKLTSDKFLTCVGKELKLFGPNNGVNVYIMKKNDAFQLKQKSNS